jgi:hypothetical protein
MFVIAGQGDEEGVKGGAIGEGGEFRSSPMLVDDPRKGIARAKRSQPKMRSSESKAARPS